MSAAPESSTLVVLGAGSWGTALAIQLARLSRPAVLWGRDPAHVAALARQRSNERYLPQAAFPDSLRVEADLAAAVRAAPDVLIAVPSHSLRLLLQEIAPHLGADARVSWATKGFELATGLLPHEVVRHVLGERVPTAVVSGPTFAKEVGAGLPTAMTVAANDATFANDLAQRLSNSVAPGRDIPHTHGADPAKLLRVTSSRKAKRPCRPSWSTGPSCRWAALAARESPTGSPRPPGWTPTPGNPRRRPWRTRWAAPRGVGRSPAAPAAPSPPAPRPGTGTCPFRPG